MKQFENARKSAVGGRSARYSSSLETSSHLPKHQPGAATPRQSLLRQPISGDAAPASGTPAQICNAETMSPETAHVCGRRLSVSDAGSDLHRRDDVWGDGPALRTLPQRKRRRLRSGTPEECFQRQRISRDAASACGTRPQIHNARPMSPETAHLPRTPAQRKERSPRSASPGWCIRRYASAGHAPPSRRGRDVLKSAG